MKRKDRGRIHCTYDANLFMLSIVSMARYRSRFRPHFAVREDGAMEEEDRDEFRVAEESSD